MSYIGKGIESVTFNTATTFDVTGNITVGGTVDGRDVATDGTKLDTITSGAIADIVQDTTPQLGGNLDLNTNDIIGTGNINVTGSVTGTSFVSTGNMSFTNNSKAIFGTSPSLEIYHDGSNSILDDVGAGNFKMQLAGSDKLEITSTGVDVTGTVTADGLTVEGATQISGVTEPSLQLLESDTTDVNTKLANAAGDFRIYTINDAGSEVAKRFQIDHPTGDISFYEDTGTTAKFFWDASAERLGIGTSSPSSHLHIESASGSNAQLRIITGDTTSLSQLIFGDSADSNVGGVQYNHTDNSMQFHIANVGEKMRMDSSGNVGIGTTNPSHKLDVQGDVDTWVSRIYNTGSDANAQGLLVRSDATSAHDAIALGVYADSGYKMVVRSTGSVGIGTSSTEGNYKLDVRGWGTFTHPSGDCNLKIQVGNTTGFSVLQFGDTADTDAGYVAYNHASNYMSFRTNGSGEDMRIDSSGNVGIGTTNPAGNKLSVEGGANGGGFYQRLKHTGSAGQNNTAIFNISTASNTNSMEVNEQYNYSAFRHYGNLVNHYSDVDNHHFRTKGGTTKMTIDSSGRVIMPSQPSFSATRSQGDVSSGTYVFSNVYHNNGNHYSNTTGRFTAPIAGLYFFSTNMMSSNAGTYNNSYYEITKNGSGYQRVYSSNGASVHHRWNWSGVIYLAAGDYISVNNPGGSSLVLYGGSNEYTTFTGFLVG